ncbi:helix-turn-helix domain-containing protein [Phytoactinopolyspora halotolerans]|uniref:Helix-turn-helix transcriptional regulator n=1 Tax=Phytoactinopolyspora halotolerans TaxID=1981512 RepID=A0A6L9S9L3_9ACTN|nr:helix-turn-helix transcriptional regulator [Phytoactinopolyspora halotolerans]NEE02065.1 helix-turn-helix transcriptional regulator [Phytoactinopolyspora halotolerans]
MRGADEHLSIGERIAFYRVRRGLTQAVLANLVGRSEDWLSKIERGERQIWRLDVLAEVARALRVTLGDLIGQPVLVEDEQNNDDVPAVRDALMNPQRLSRVLFSRDESHLPEVSQVEQLTSTAWSNYQDGQLGKAIAVLPQLIKAAQALENERVRDGWRVSARVHHLAATALSKVGEADLAWIAAERAMGAADQSDDPLVLASAARAGTHALLSVGRYDDALSLGETARSWLASRLREGDAEALSLLGMLDLRMAIAAARRQDRPTATRLLHRAESAAGQLGEDANHWQTAFGPTNVALHQISAALDLGDSTYVAEHGPRVDPAPLPVERQICHHINVARAYSDLAQDEAAIETLLDAEQRAPQFVRHSVMVRETVRAIHRRSPVTMGGRNSDVMQLAERCRAV